MARLHQGNRMPDFQFCTPYEEEGSARELVERGTYKRFAFIFLRYYGCTLCQYHMHRYAEQYSEITAKGGGFCVVLQSHPETIRRELGENTLPYTVICDPERRLYEALEIQPAADSSQLMGGDTRAKVQEARKWFTHKEYEGEELQMPAVFVVDRELLLTYVRYGENAGDVPGPEELKRLLETG